MIEIPQSIRVNTGDQQEVYQRIDAFFDEIQKYLEGDKTYRPIQCERRVMGLTKDTLMGEVTTRIPTDETVHLLLYYQRVVANVTETRDERNWICFDFFRKDLDQVLRDCEHLEEKVRE